jgi:hypothetical protein
VDAEDITLSLLEESVTRPFRHEAERRGLSFDVTIAPELRSITTDSKRLQQVLKNLLSNAIKFTEHGGVRMRVAGVTSGWTPTHPVLATASTVVAFEVSDTGIGILPEKQRIIFEAFQQADASTNRRYGGTGLGLAISRELANLLGGEIHLRSRAGEGSTFTLYLPQSYVGPARVMAKGAGGTRFEVRADGGAVHRTEEALPQPTDDRAHLAPGDAALLIVEDDPHYSRILVDLARDVGLKVLVATRGVDALTLAREFSPLAISLDVFLPDMLGWAVLSQLKQDPRTRHIPVQIVTLDEDRQHGLAGGAFAYVNKPTTMDKLRASIARLSEYARDSRKRLLIVEDNPAELLGITELLAYEDIEVVTADNGREALAMLRERPTDCVVLDLKLPDMSGFELLEHIRQDDALTQIPVVVFTGRELSPEEDAQLHSIARSVIVKGVESPERLLDETALFLHRVVADLPPDKQRMLERLRNSDENLHGRKALLVDDDARNIFALSSVLERRGMQVLTATTGHEAISILKADRGISIVLMDIMMPEMDGYETIQAIRKDPSMRRMPIIALTAKAMKGDRERCLEAGASDYLAKPVNTEQLLSALRIWLHR